MKERQLEIIEAAGKILTASGVRGLTIKNLAKEMKFSESAVYRHFESKETIIVAMLNYLTDSMDEQLTDTIELGDAPDEKFRRMFRNRFEFFKRYPHFVVVVFSDGLIEQSGRINEAIFRIMKVTKNHLVPIIREGQQKGIFTKMLNSEELVHIVMGTFRLQMFKWRLAKFEFDISKNGNKLIKSLLTLIENK